MIRASFVWGAFLVCVCTPFGLNGIGEGRCPGSFRPMAWFSRVDGLTSLPLIGFGLFYGKPWEYFFFIDVLGHREDTGMRNALSRLVES